MEFFKNKKFLIFISYSIVLILIGDFFGSNFGMQKKIERVEMEQREIFQSKMEEKDKQILDLKKSIDDYQQNNIVSTTEITKKDGEKIKKVVVNRTYYKILYMTHEQSLNLKQEENSTKDAQHTNVSSEKIEIKSRLKTFSIAIHSQFIPVQITKNIHIGLGMRIFQTPFWAQTMIGANDKSVSLGLSLEF